MFKLLTDEERQKVAREYAMHRAIVIFLGFILVIVVGIIGLLPSYVLSNARQNEALERIRIMNSAVKKGDEVNLQAWLEEINRKLQILSPSLDTDRPSDFIEKILEQRIMDITVSDFSWVKAKDKISFSIKGRANSRQSLIRFEDSINSSGYFSKVTLPLSNLIKDRDIDFQIQFSPLP